MNLSDMNNEMGVDWLDGESIALFLYPKLLVAGMSIEEFWDNTIPENMDYLCAYNEGQRIKNENDRINAYVSCQILTKNIASLIDTTGKVKMPTYDEIWGTNYQEENKRVLTEEEQKKADEFKKEWIKAKNLLSSELNTVL